MDQLFAILGTQPSVKEGDRPLPTAAAAGASSSSSPSIAAAALHEDPSVERIASSQHASSSSSAAVSAPANGKNGNGHAGVAGFGSGAASVTAAAAGEGEEDSGAAGGLSVRLEDVHFGYLPEREVLRGVTIEALPGQSIAVVGPSGSGKSTILKVLLRTYDCTGGRVLLDGTDVKDLTEEALRGSAAVVPQETVLFNDTIMANIRYGRPDATEAEVVEAARAAQLHEAILRMPGGYDTAVGERGVKLSGGEKQRVAIARAILRNPRLLVCDEATSALDSETERSIMACLRTLARGRTAVVVAHRLSTVRTCDVIYVLRQGKVVERGSHDDLLTIEGGLYKSMWDMQQQEERLHQMEENLDSGDGEEQEVAAGVAAV
jgi:ABC-type multidrug transport system fused ATPase/permease subunit